MITSNNGRLSLSDYLTRTNLRGVLFIGAGLVALAIPTASQFLLAVVVATVLVVNGVADLYASLTAKPTKWTGVLLGALYMVTGLGLLISTNRTIRALTVFVGLIAILRGVAVAASALHARKVRPTWTFDLIRGLLFIAVGGIVITLPETVIAGLIFAAAGTAIVVGAITLSFGITHAEDDDADVLEVGGYVKAWLDERDLGDEMRDEVVDNLYFEPPGAVQKQAGFWVLLTLSVAIATLGIIADSTAVVIGAMLVAPLMTPIMGVSAGIVNGWPRRVSTAFATVTGGVAVSIGVAWIVASWTPQLIPLSSNTQVLSRISPTLVDMMIAVAAGAAGAYATVDRRVSSSIIGVAIAVALVPPLGVVGIALKAGQFSDAGGAFLLFLTNLVSIILVASVVFVVTGLVPIEQFKTNRQKMRTVISTVTLGALVIMVPLIFASEGIIASATRQSTARSVAETWLGDQEGLTLKKVEVKTNDVTVVITGEGNVPPVDDLRVELEDEFKTRIFVVVEYFPSVRLSSGGP